MKISLIPDKCEAHGDCVVAAPELFDLGDTDEVVRILDEAPGEEHRAKVELAIRLCPVSALVLED